MTTNNKRDMARLQAVLDAHGANPARWPASEAAALMAFAKADAQGVKMLAQARALDQVLGVAPGSSARGLDDLTDRIMVKAAATKPGVGSSAEIVPLPVRARASSGVLARRSLHVWQVCGAMAAALLIGVYVGGSDLVVPAFQQVAGLSQDEVEAGAPAAQQVSDEPQEGELL